MTRLGIIVAVAAPLASACLGSDGGGVASDSSATDITAEVEVEPEDATVATTLDVAEELAPEVVVELPHFSFFITSLAALQDLSESELGFGGDLSFGQTGPGAGLRGADLLCTMIAERSMPGAGQKEWHAFLSADAGDDGNAVDAIDRIGAGPWYDRLGRVVSEDVDGLLNTRPDADAAIKNDLPNEDGVPNHRPDPTKAQVDNHHMLTGSTTAGKLYGATATCDSWTSTTVNERPRVGLAWPRGGGGGGGGADSSQWMSALSESGCAPGVNFSNNGPGTDDGTVGSGGGYGGWYCFALTP